MGFCLECKIQSNIRAKMRRIYQLFFFTLILFTFAWGNLEIEPPSFLENTHAMQNEPRLVINNRPLAKINRKVISLYDVVKKMNLFLYEYYPDYKVTAVDLFQFYTARWEATLDDMIADELVLLDAEQKEIKVSDGEVREALEERFGPNIMSNLDKVNLQYEEARAMIRSDLTIQQLIGMKVHSKAFQTITPQVIIKAYEDYLEKNPPEEEWSYQVLSIRGKDNKQCEKLAQKAYHLLQEKGTSLDAIMDEIGEEGVTISLSDDYSGTTQKISKQHFDIVKTLTPHSFSLPVSQVSRFDNSTVFRIFHLKSLIKKLPESLNQMHDKLKNELLFTTADKEKKNYIELLKKRFGYDLHDPKFELPEDYRPFALL